MAFDKNIQKLSKLLATLDENHLSKADFEEAMKKIVGFLTEVNKRNREEFVDVTKKLAQTFDGLKSDIKAELDRQVGGRIQELSASEQKTVKTLDAALKGIERVVEDRLSELKDGESPAVETIVEALKPFIPAPLQGSPDTAEDIRNKLELLEGDERLSIDAIRGLKEELAKKAVVTGGGIVGRDLVKNYDLSSQLDGVTKTFNIPGTWSIIGVYCSSFPHALRPTIDYTYTPQTITFTSEIDETTTLATGQTVVLTIVSA